MASQKRNHVILDKLVHALFHESFETWVEIWDVANYGCKQCYTKGSLFWNAMTLFMRQYLLSLHSWILNDNLPSHRLACHAGKTSHKQAFLKSPLQQKSPLGQKVQTLNCFLANTIKPAMTVHTGSSCLLSSPLLSSPLLFSSLLSYFLITIPISLITMHQHQCILTPSFLLPLMPLLLTPAFPPHLAFIMTL